jgi:DNA-directed RNA polymerase specialized sigma24 family protein
LLKLKKDEKVQLSQKNKQVRFMKLNWNHIVDDIGPRLFRYFSFRCGDLAADDLTQETLLRLFRKVEESQFDPQRGGLRAFSWMPST